MEETFIPINRKKMVVMTVMYSIIGLVAFLGFYYFGEGLKDSLGKTGTAVFKTLALIILVVFIVVAGSYGKKIKDKSAGLKINREGIIDETSSIAVGVVKWKQITEIEFLKSLTSTSILIHVKKPDTFLKAAKNKAVARLLNQNIAIYKTPIVINASVLTTEIVDLANTFRVVAGRYGSNIKVK